MLASVLLLLATAGAVVSAEKPELQAELLEVQEEFVQVKVTEPVGNVVEYTVQYEHNGATSGDIIFKEPIFKVEGLQPNTGYNIFIEACGLPAPETCTDKKKLIATTTIIKATFEIQEDVAKVSVSKPIGKDFDYVVKTSQNNATAQFKNATFQVEGLKRDSNVDISVKACGPTIRQKCTDPITFSVAGKGLPGWATALIVVLVLAVLAGVGFIVAKRRGLIN